MQIHLYMFFICAKVRDNRVARLHFITSFAKCVKRNVSPRRHPMALVGPFIHTTPIAKFILMNHKPINWLNSKSNSNLIWDSLN